MQGHPGVSKMLIELRKRYYVPYLTVHVQHYASNCLHCIKTKPVNVRSLKPPLENIYDTCNGPKVLLEIDLVGEFPKSNGFTHVLTACDYLSRYLFAIAVKKLDTKSVVLDLIQIFTQHACVIKTILTDKGSAFTSQVMAEIMEESGIHIEHATVKHALTIGLVECTHQKLKEILKTNVAADTPQWDKYVNIAFMAHNTTYHQSQRCSPAEVFHGRVPYNTLDLKFTNPLQSRNVPVDLQKLLDSVNEKYKQTQSHILEAFHKYKHYYDRKAQAAPLNVNDFTIQLNPKLSNQSAKISFHEFIWAGL